MQQNSKRIRWKTALLLATLPVVAAADSGGETGFNVLVSQRVWFATWDQAVSDLVITDPGTETTLPRARAAQVKNLSSKQMPISSIGLRYGRFTAALSHYGRQQFDGNGIYATDTVSRSETDVSLAYQVVPGVSVALIGKFGKNSSSQTRQATELIGLDVSSKGRGTLLGLSVNAPLGDSIVLYGNFAYGPAKFRFPAGTYQPVKGHYTISEAGIGWRLPIESLGPLKTSMSIQLGYRSQVLSTEAWAPSDFEGVPLVVDLVGPKARNVTDGAVLSINLIF